MNQNNLGNLQFCIQRFFLFFQFSSFFSETLKDLISTVKVLNTRWYYLLDKSKKKDYLRKFDDTQVTSDILYQK